MKKELCDKTYSLHSRLRLFQATVGATVLYGSSAWTLTAERAHLLRTTQRKMLRKSIGTPRHLQSQQTDATNSSSNSSEDSSSDSIDDADDRMSAGESWVEWIRRSTHIAEVALTKAGVSDWVVGHRKRLWRFAGHTARRRDGRWNTELLSWIPTGFRFDWRPKRRWSDALDEFWLGRGVAAGGWIEHAQDRDRWHALEVLFASAD